MLKCVVMVFTFLTTTGQITKLYYPYYERTLANEIELKAGDNFAEPQVWYLFYHLAQVNAFLQKYLIHNTQKQSTSYRYQTTKCAHHSGRPTKGGSTGHVPKRYLRI